MSGVELYLNKVTVPPTQLKQTERITKEEQHKTCEDSEIKLEQQTDMIEKSAGNELISKKPESLKEKFANVCKTFVKTGDYLKATGATVIYGGLAAGAIMFSNWLVKGWTKVFKKQIPLKDMFSKPLKCVSKSSKILAGIAFAATGGYQFAKAYLKANQHAAHVDQRLNNYSKVKS